MRETNNIFFDHINASINLDFFRGLLFHFISKVFKIRIESKLYLRSLCVFCV